MSLTDEDVNVLLAGLPFGNADPRCYKLNEIANCVLAGQDLSKQDRESFKDFPYALQFLDLMASKRSSGMTRFHASPGPEATVESFAQALLAVEWAIEHGHSHRVQAMDGLIFSFRGGFRTNLKAWLSDRLAGYAMQYRKFKTRNLKNPYEAKGAK